jgi:hypothetical protein
MIIDDPDAPDPKAPKMVQHKESSFLRAFLDAREKTIRPAMVEVGEYVRGMGYTFRISTEEDGLSMAGTNPFPFPPSRSFVKSTHRECFSMKTQRVAKAAALVTRHYPS